MESIRWRSWNRRPSESSRPLRRSICGLLGRLWEIESWRRLLPCHGDAEALLRVDVVVVVVDADVELNPVDLAGEPARVRGVVAGDGGAGLVADVGGLVGGEDHRLGGLDPALADLRAVVEQADVAAL